MREWLSYRPGDFLLFSPRTYWRLFELENAAVWPLQIAALLVGAAILAALMRPRRWSDRAVWAALAAAWASVAFGFLWTRYAPVNWLASYAGWAFLGQALLLLALGGLAGRLPVRTRRDVPGAAGLALFVYALALHPLVAPLSGRPVAAAEVAGIAPDPTAIATLGLLTLARRDAATALLMPVPLAWCAASAATLRTMGAWEGWIPSAAAGLAVAAWLWPRRVRRSG